MTLFKRRSKELTLSPDPTLGHAPARRVLDEAERGNWIAIRDELTATTDWDDRELLVTALAESLGAERWLTPWLKAEPNSAAALTADGAYQVHQAWAARGHGIDPTVEQFGAFHEILAAADSRLAEAAVEDDSDPTPCVYRVMAARGLEVDREELRSRFNEVTARHPHNRFGHNQMLQGLAAKWGGSHDDMFSFARSAAASAPDGSGLHALVAEAHIERTLMFLISEPSDVEGFEQYWRRPKVVDELIAAAERSVLSPLYHEYARAAFDRNLFAYCFWMADLFEPAATLFAALGDTVSSHPWAYLGDAGQAFTRARDESAAVR